MTFDPHRESKEARAGAKEYERQADILSRSGHHNAARHHRDLAALLRAKARSWDAIIEKEKGGATNGER